MACSTLPVAFSTEVCHPPCWKPTWRLGGTKPDLSQGALALAVSRLWMPWECSTALESHGASSTSAGDVKTEGCHEISEAVPQSSIQLGD